MTMESGTQTIQSGEPLRTLVPRSRGGGNDRSDGNDQEDRGGVTTAATATAANAIAAPLTSLIKEAVSSSSTAMPTQAQVRLMQEQQSSQSQPPQRPQQKADFWSASDPSSALEGTLEEILDPISDDQIDGDEIIDYWNNCCPSKPFLPIKSSHAHPPAIPVRRGLHSRGSSSRIDENIFAVPLHDATNANVASGPSKLMHAKPKQQAWRPSSSGGRVGGGGAKTKVGTKTRKKFVPVTSLLKKPRTPRA
jgi:hypothetical protein